MTLKQVFSKQRLVALALMALAVIICVLAYAVLKKVAYAKTEPYLVSLTVEGVPDSTVFLSYDYGFGIRDQHIQRLELTEKTQRFELSISAWKTVRALYFIGPQETPYVVKDLTISKSEVNHQVKIPSDGPTLEGTNFLYRLSLTDFKY